MALLPVIYMNIFNIGEIMKFKSRSVLLLKRNGPGVWSIIRGNIRTSFVGLYQTFQKAYGAIEDKDRITKIRIEIFRDK